MRRLFQPSPLPPPRFLFTNLHAQILWSAPAAWTGTAAVDISTLGISLPRKIRTAPWTTREWENTIFDTAAPGVSIFGVGPGGPDGSGSNATPYLEALNGCTYVNVTPGGGLGGVSQVATIGFNGLTKGEFIRCRYGMLFLWEVDVTPCFPG